MAVPHPAPTRSSARTANALMALGLVLLTVDWLVASRAGSAAWRVLGAAGWGALASAAHLGLGPVNRSPEKTPSRPLDRTTGWFGCALVVGLGSWLRWGALGQPTGGPDAALVMAVETWPSVASVVVFALAPALGEESFFRGAALRWLAARQGAVIAWVVSTACFAVVHPGSHVSAAVFGAALAALALRTGRVREAIVAHAAHNLLGLGALGLWGA